MGQVRMFLAIEVVGFALAALVHAGVLLEGYQHHEARIAETVIAAVLLFGLIGSLAAPARTRAIGLGVQAFALLGTCVGIFTMIIGVGPQSGFDIALHAGFVTVLIAGLLAARQAGAFGAPA